MTAMEKGPIGVFDSGVGGLSLVQALQKELPEEDIVYFADLARLPYGEKTSEEVRQFSLQVARFLLSQQAKCLVVACSTASSVALEFLSHELEVPVVGILNDLLLKHLVAVSVSQRVGVLCTTLTAKSESFRKWIQASYPQIQVFSQACPQLVNKISQGDLSSQELRSLAAQDLKPLLEEKKVDTVVLGCTHFNFIKEVLKSLIPPSVKLVAAPPYVAQYVRLLLNSQQLLHSKSSQGHLSITTSKADAVFSEFADRFFGVKDLLVYP